MKWCQAMRVAAAASALLLSCDDSDDSEPGVPQDRTLTYHADWVHSSTPLTGWNHRGLFDWYTVREVLLLSELDSSAVESPEDEVELRILECAFNPYAISGSGHVTVDPTSYGSMTQRVGVDTTVTSLEFMMHVRRMSDGGKLLLDFGVFSEDVLQNGILDTEDLNGDGWTVSEIEDVGLDRMRGPDVPWPIPIELAEWEGSDSVMVDHFGEFHDYQDLDFNGTRTVDEPWSQDDFTRAPYGYTDWDRISKSHGWERNSQDTDQLYPDTEDLNRNWRLDLDEGFYRYEIPLDPVELLHPPTITEVDRSDWYRVRIDLYDSNRRLFGIPDPFQPMRLRMSLTDFRDPVALQFAAFRFQ